MPYRVTGKALNTLGTPLDGAQVCITGRQAPYQSLGRPITDANGDFSQDVGEFSDQVRVTGHLNGVKPIIDFDQPEFYESYVLPQFDQVGGDGSIVAQGNDGYLITRGVNGFQGSSITIDPTKAYLFKVVGSTTSFGRSFGFTFESRDFSGASISNSDWLGNENQTFGFSQDRKTMITFDNVNGQNSNGQLTLTNESYCYVNFSTGQCIVDNGAGEFHSLTYLPDAPQKLAFYLTKGGATEQFELVLSRSAIGTPPASIPSDWAAIGE